MKGIKKIILPKIGMRIIKTALAVLITLLFTDLLFRRVLKIQQFVSVFAVVSAILTIQDSIKSSFSAALERCIGTMIGVAVGMLFLTIDLLLDKNIYAFYTFITVGTVLVIYGCKVVKKASASSLCVVVFIAVLFSRDEASPYLAAGVRILETLLGVVIALLVNVLVFPPKTQKIGVCKGSDSYSAAKKLNDSIISLSELQPDLPQDITEGISPNEMILIDRRAFSGNAGKDGGSDDVVELPMEIFVKAFGIKDADRDCCCSRLECYNFDEDRAIEAASSALSTEDIPQYKR